MGDKSAFVSGFGPFERVQNNASGALAELLEQSPPAGFRIQGQGLPVSFERAGLVLEQALRGRSPELLVGLGQHPGQGFRLELRAARGASGLRRVDVDGVPAGASAWSLEPGACWRDELWTSLEAELLAFARWREGWSCSAGAGSYVCERVFRWLLEEGERRSIPALFVHLPSLDCCSKREQLEQLQNLLLELEF